METCFWNPPAKAPITPINCFRTAYGIFKRVKNGLQIIVARKCRHRAITRKLAGFNRVHPKMTGRSGRSSLTSEP
jgi:hypothetical protein